MRVKDLKITKKMNEIFHKNVILYVFTKEYKDEIMYRELMKKKIDIFKLKSDDDFDLTERIKLLEKSNFKSNFEMSE